MTTLIAFTDLHGDAQAARRVAAKARRARAEFLVCAGDFSLFGGGHRQALNIFPSLGLPIYFVPGNHDRDIAAELAVVPFVNVAERPAFRGGILLVGIPEEAAAQDAGLLLDEDVWDRIAETLRRAPPGTRRIVVSHYPPEGTRCRPPPVPIIGSPGEFASGPALSAGLVRGWQADLLVCGHYHQCFGVRDRLGETRVVNPGPGGMKIEV
jgi:Icc-related predicted phosphoesterase